MTLSATGAAICIVLGRIYKILKQQVLALKMSLSNNSSVQSWRYILTMLTGDRRQTKTLGLLKRNLRINPLSAPNLNTLIQYGTQKAQKFPKEVTKHIIG